MSYKDRGKMFPDVGKVQDPREYPEPIGSAGDRYGRRQIHPPVTSGNPLLEAGHMQINSSMPPVPGMKLLMDQVSALEDQVRTLTMRQNYLIEENHGYKGKLETSFKTVNEQTTLLVNDLINRVTLLDEGLKKEATRSSMIMEKVLISSTVSCKDQDKSAVNQTQWC